MSGKLFHAPFINAHPGFELTGIVERHQSESGQPYPSARIYRSVDELCNDPIIQMIVVNTPTHLHYEHSLKVLRAGKHLIVEKPFTITVREAEHLATFARERKLFLSVYQNRRYDGDYRAVKDIVEKGLLGPIREVEISFERYRPVFGGKQHKEGDLPGAGILYDLSPHLVDQALQLFGWPRAIFADIWQMRDDVYAPDYFELLLFFDRMRVRLKATCIAREGNYGYVLHGMKGSYLQRRSDVQELQLLAGAKPTIGSWCVGLSFPDGILHTEHDGNAIREETHSKPGNYMGYYDDVHKALAGAGENPVPAEQAILNIKIIEAALQSMNEKKIIYLS